MAYKYDTAHDWLRAHVLNIEDASTLRGIILSFAGKLDGDDIQDEFQREMAADGFFEDESAVMCARCAEYIQPDDERHDTDTGTLCAPCFAEESDE